MKIPANGFTHAGKFHADDVFATALLHASAKEITIYKYTDDTTMMADYMNGVIDVAINLTADDCDEIAADSSLFIFLTSFDF